MDYPKISIWITSTGRFEFLKTTLDSFLEKNTYPDVEFRMFESIPTLESKKAFPHLDPKTEDCVDYMKYLPTGNKALYIMPWPPYGNVLQELLDTTSADYCLVLEDDCEAVCDPRDQIIDAITLMKCDPKLLGMRLDLSNPDVNEQDKRFAGVKKNSTSDYLYWPVAGGAPIMDVNKLRQIGGYITNHPLEKFGMIESDLNAKMRKHGMYIGVMLKYFGVFKHIGSTCVDGRDRSWSSNGYEEYARNGWFGLRNKGNK